MKHSVCSCPAHALVCPRPNGIDTYQEASRGARRRRQLLRSHLQTGHHPACPISGIRFQIPRFVRNDRALHRRARECVSLRPFSPKTALDRERLERASYTRLRNALEDLFGRILTPVPMLGHDAHHDGAPGQARGCGELVHGLDLRRRARARRKVRIKFPPTDASLFARQARVCAGALWSLFLFLGATDCAFPGARFPLARSETPSAAWSPPSSLVVVGRERSLTRAQEISLSLSL